MENESKRQSVLLIVEDEINLREALVEILTPIAGTIHVVGNGAEALQIVRKVRIDAVLTDIKMPVMSGLEFLAELRSLFIQTPVIVVTGQGDMATILEALRLDATDFLEKPFDRENLIKVTKKALAYGVALREMEVAIDHLYSESKLPEDDLARLKKIKRVTLGMKLGFSTYIKKVS